MSVEDTPYQALFRTLNIGSFPKDIAKYSESGDYFHNLVHIDYQLQSTLASVSPGSLFHVDSKADGKSKIESLIQHATSINSQYANTDKSYLEVYYGSVVLAHLQVLGEDFEGAIATLNGFRIDPSVSLQTLEENEFLDYLVARFHSLLGMSSRNSVDVWSVFLESMRRYGNASQVSANLWIDSIFQALLKKLSSNGTRPLDLKDLQSQKFAKNLSSLIPLANYAVNVENEKLLSPSFAKDYSRFISEVLVKKINEKKSFPDASDENSEENDFVQSFYQTLNNISTHRPVINYFVSPKLSKRFLINMSEKTYQSQTVVFHLIVSLIDLGELDEALAAFKTFVSYVERGKVQTGAISDILQVVELYSLCLHSFNPTNSFIPDARSSSPKFKYNTIDTVLLDMAKYAQDLRSYTNQAVKVAELIQTKSSEDNTDPLSFLYHRFNPNTLIDKKSTLIQIVSGAWYALGKFHEYLAKHGSSTSSILKLNTNEVLSLYKSSLIINPVERFETLFDYALSLAYENKISEAFKLSKFILGKYPNSFKTWNLLVLLATSIRTNKSLNDVEISSAHADSGSHTILSNDQSDESNHTDTLEVDSPEKFVEDALSIANSYITKCHETKKTVSTQTGYEILQLKMTQLAVWESEFGVESILEHLADVFALYRELFSGVSSTHKSSNGRKPESKGSSRPALSDADVPNGDAAKAQTAKHSARDKLKRLSRLSMDSLDRKSNVDTKEPKHDKHENNAELRILQEVWLWTASIYLRLGFLEEAEQCIVEAETTHKPNVRTHTLLGFLTSKSRKKLALQEFERSIEIFRSPGENFDQKSFGLTLMGMSQFLITDGEGDNGIFISEKDRDAGLVRIKNYLETFSNCWPYGHNSAEVWYYLSAIYENFDDKVLQSEALWRCVELESSRPVRSFDNCEDFTL